MNDSALHPPAQAFFLNAEPGQRFCLYHPPAQDANCKGAVLYIHSFGDEMNMARRMAASQARTFAAMGVAVLQIDLFGCGDSSGEFSEARWAIWKEDVAIAIKWLTERHAAPISLWGLRLGALLALDFAKHSGDAISSLILWQPVTQGETFLTQFLRLRLANQMMDEGAEKIGSTRALREALAAGEVLEVAGYDIAPALAAAIDALDVATLSPTGSTVHWVDITSDSTRPMTPANARVVGVWEQEGIDLKLHRVSCAPFWSAQEVINCPELLSVTASTLAEGSK